MKINPKPKQKFRFFKSKKMVWLKRATIFSFIVLPIVFIGAFAYRNVEIINFEGSSTMKPLIDNLAEKYLKITKDVVDINVQSGGSGTGLRKSLSGQTKFGNYSDDVTKNANARLIEWNQKQMKTMTIAWDGMGLIYNPPFGCNDNLVINKDNVQTLYRAFSGVNAKNLNFKDLLNNNETNLCEERILPYPRTGGSKSSGTAAAFIEGNHILDLEDFQKNYQSSYDALSNGSYGSDLKITPTNEANSSAYDIFSSNNQKGSMIYLSMSFILNNYDSIISRGYKLAGFQKEDAISPTFLNKNNWQNELGNNYAWYRPLNVLVSLIGIKSHEKNFIDWIYKNEQKSIIQKNFYGTLTKDQYTSMTKSNNFWVSDFELNNKHGAFSPLIKNEVN